MRKATLILKPNQIQRLSTLPIFQYIEFKRYLSKLPVYKKGKKSIFSKKNDSHIKVGLVDGNIQKNSHAKEMESIILNKQNLSNQIQLHYYDINNTNLSRSILQMLRKNIYISNHSYSYNDNTKIGDYDIEAYAQDFIVYNNPTVNIFQASGNIDTIIEPNKKGNIKGPANAKNIFTIGALDKSNKVCITSAHGPTNDKRVKPDFCDYQSYQSLQTYGTSVATALSTKNAILLSILYTKITGKRIRHNLLKAILVNTSIKIDNKKVDTYSGYGKIDIKNATKLINTLKYSSKHIKTSNIKNGEIQTFSFYVENNNSVNITISWIDPPANPSYKKTLINDLDIWIQYKKRLYYPYSLQPNTDRLNHSDSTEHIELKNLQTGKYTIFVKGNQIITSSQKFVLVIN